MLLFGQERLNFARRYVLSFIDLLCFPIQFRGNTSPIEERDLCTPISVFT